jgi:uncharacterized membrane protein YcaP (DUF421 family)
MDPVELAATAARALGVYVAMLVVIRLMGKRTVGNFTAFDLLVALMFGEVVDEIIFADVGLAQGAVAIGVLALVQSANAWLSYSNERFARLVEGTPTAVVVDGALQRDGMRAERLNEKDVMSALRLQGVDDVREVKLAMVENDGEISVLRRDWAEPLQKADLRAEAARERRADTGGRRPSPRESPASRQQRS